jgi:hypothetical protein
MTFAVVSMSEAAADGDDEGYLRWHLLDHLPEQYGIDGVRHGERWRRAGSPLVAETPYDRVEHVVMYLFDDRRLDVALDEFFELGAELREAGRMPVSLPRVEVGGWSLTEAVTSTHALVRPDVLPWRPHRGVFVIIESDVPGHGLGELLEVPGVAGAWRFRRDGTRHRRLPPAEGDVLTVCFVDGELGEVPVGGALLAAPFEIVTL